MRCASLDIHCYQMISVLFVCLFVYCYSSYVNTYLLVEFSSAIQRTQIDFSPRAASTKSTGRAIFSPFFFCYHGEASAPGFGSAGTFLFLSTIYVYMYIRRNRGHAWRGAGGGCLTREHTATFRDYESYMLFRHRTTAPVASTWFLFG